MDYILGEIKRFSIEKKLKDILFFDNAKEYSLEWGMNYITFSSSKRIRPLLLLESNQVFSKIDDDSYILSGAIELIHTYSLVHDDLPCMDDDDYRRGIKTLHKIKDEAYAVLVGDALLTRAFEVLSNYSKKDKLSELLKLYTKKAGFTGMIYGQVLDLEAEKKKLSVNDINKINKHKTCALLELSMLAGAINGGADGNELSVIENIGNVIGYIFQIQDDILDIIGDSKVMGKSTGSDEKNNKSSIPLMMGLEKAKSILNEYHEDAHKYIDRLPSGRDFFYRLVDYLVTRKK